jgi:hypothetical protein
MKNSIGKVLLLSGLSGAFSLFLFPQPVHFIGAATTIAIVYYIALRLMLKYKLGRLLRVAPYLGLTASFAYLRSYPFNPDVPAFWAMVFTYVCTQVFTLALLASAYRQD